MISEHAEKQMPNLSDKTLPSVSVIMGIRYVRKDIHMLQRAIKSILNQTYPHLEVLICDDGSSEKAKDYLDRTAIQDPRVRLLRRENAFDLSSKLNICLKEAKGGYIARMDDDDRSHPERIQQEVGFLQDHPDIAFVGCNVNLYQDGNKVGVRILPEYPKVEDFYFTQPYIHPALIFRREALMAAKGYSESKDCELCEDYDLLLRLYKLGYTGANLQKELLDYTISINPKGNRLMKHRLSETKTRYKRFKDLGKLPKAFPYVIKPIAVGLLPTSVLGRMKSKHAKGIVLDNGNCRQIGK